MSDCFKLISQKEDAFISHRRPPFFTIVSGPSSTSASSQLALFGAFGALCGLYLVVLGRAPPGLSPLQFLYAISGGRLDAITQEDLTRWDPELLALMQDLRLQGPRIDFGNFRSGEWLDRICHFLGGPVRTSVWIAMCHSADRVASLTQYFVRRMGSSMKLRPMYRNDSGRGTPRKRRSLKA